MHWVWHIGLSDGKQQISSSQAGVRHSYTLSSSFCWLILAMLLWAMMQTPIARLIGVLLACSPQKAQGYACWRNTNMRGGEAPPFMEKLWAMGRRMTPMD